MTVDMDRSVTSSDATLSSSVLFRIIIMTVVAVGTLSWINGLSNHQFNCGTFLLFVESTNIRIRQIKTIKPSNVLLLSWRGRSFWRFSSSLYSSHLISSHLSYSYHSTTKEMAGAPYDTRRGLKKYRSFLPSFLSPFVLSTVQCTALQCFSVSECNISRVESRGERLAHATEPHPTFSGVVIVCYCPILFAVSTILCLSFISFFESSWVVKMRRAGQLTDTVWAIASRDAFSFSLSVEAITEKHLSLFPSFWMIAIKWQEKGMLFVHCHCRRIHRHQKKKNPN